MRTFRALRAKCPGHRQAGFTLIEVMIVVGIIAILAGIAIPSYRDYILRGRLVDATNALATFRGNMERHFQDHRTYASSGAFVSPCLLVDEAQRKVGDFVISCVGNPGPTSYVLQAVGSGSTEGFTFTVNQQDARSSTTPWGNCTTRWVLKKGQAC
jgi:prepilin-type N-terminal cleavage/methylation domain-containing protein